MYGGIPLLRDCENLMTDNAPGRIHLIACVDAHGTTSSRVGARGDFCGGFLCLCVA